MATEELVVAPEVIAPRPRGLGTGLAVNRADRAERIAGRFRGVVVMRTAGHAGHRSGGRRAMTTWPALARTPSWLGPPAATRGGTGFASWTDDALRRNRKTYVLGGQASLFSDDALRAVAERSLTPRPVGHGRAGRGPAPRWARRRKRDEGMSRLRDGRGQERRV